MSGTSNLLIGGTNLGNVVISYKRTRVTEGLIEFRTLSGNIRYQDPYEKYVYTFECISTVNTYNALEAELASSPVANVQYHATGWAIDLASKSCLVRIEDEDYTNFLTQPVNGVSTEKYVKFTVSCKEM